MNKKLISIAMILLLSNLAVLFLFSAVKEIRFDENKIPTSYGGWHKTNYDVGPLVKEILETDQVYSFLFQKGKAYVGLSIVYYPKGQIAFHLPEGCNVGAGESIVSRDRLVLPGAWGNSIATHFIARNREGNLRHHAYAFATDQEAAGNYFRFRYHLMMMGITRNVQSCALLNMSVTGKDSAMDERIILQEFWRDISPALKSAISGNLIK